MWLILCSAKDLPALWAYRGLTARGLSPVELVTAESLAFALKWEHRLNSHGVETRITLADGRVIESRRIKGTINRLTYIPVGHLGAFQEADRAYAEQELFALFASWLFGLPGPMLNPPTPQGLCGAPRTRSEWVWLAARAGLPCPLYRQGAPAFSTAPRKGLIPDPRRLETVIVVNNRTTGAKVPPAISHGCINLSKLAGVSILGVDLSVDAEGGCSFVDATPAPDLRAGGEALIDALEEALQTNGDPS